MRRFVLAPLLIASGLAPSNAQRPASPRATLRLQWTSDSSYDGVYREKLHRVRVHEELAGQLTFDVGEGARVIQLRPDGSAVGAQLVSAAGSTTYTTDIQKEGGDCTAEGGADVPYTEHGEARAPWDSAAPGVAVIVFSAGAPVGIAFAPKSMLVESNQQILCPRPEKAFRREHYRMTIRVGSLASPADGRWTMESHATAGGYAGTASYAWTSAGSLNVRKTLVFAWERAP